MEDEAGNSTISRGRPSLLQSVPNFLNLMQFTLERHANVSAHRRRRSEENIVTGMSLKLLADKMSAQIGQKVFGRALRLYFGAPNKRVHSRHEYYDLLNARISTRLENKIGKHCPDSHFCAAQVKYVMEMASDFAGQVALYSADDKATMRIGTLAVDRRMRIKKVVLGDSNPQVADHDFPVPSYLLSLSGYEELTGIDTMMWGHFILPKFESLHIREVFKFRSTSAALHAFNIETILAKMCGCLILVFLQGMATITSQ
eukprot:TRINITY_DN22977_c0_g1_i2.p1 TRINITY_DN22977_c0_g1~~TRINITY_DN22977_c0_g1_i2.p1  ORF type:complete len:258 (-),score=51.57 TRINITY_DN22977_c0_g1_i2:88-861(-)